MGGARIDQVNVVVADVIAAAGFLAELGVDVGGAEPDWLGHHRRVATVDEGFDADLDSAEFARYWGGLPEGFTGVVVNLRVDQREEVDDLFDQSVSHGAKELRAPYDAFWGARVAVVEAPGPLCLGLMSRSEPAHRTRPPAVDDFT